MARTHSKIGRGALALVAAAAVIGVAAVTALAAPNRQTMDVGIEMQKMLAENSQALYGFGAPVAESASTPSNSEPGDQAVTAAQGLTVTLISDKVGIDADMMVFWPSDEEPTHVILCNEIDGAEEGSAATVQSLNLSDGAVTDIAFGMTACDPVDRTPWGTITVAEEAGPTGRLYEILDPLNTAGVMIDRVAGTTSDETKVTARPAVGQLSWESTVFLPDGTLYYADELRPNQGRPGGAIYKFVPSTPWAQDSTAITSLDDSPLAEGDTYTLRLGLRNNPGDYGQGSNTGAGKWIGPLSKGDLVAAGVWGTGYYRPEDMELDPIAWAADQTRICWANTGNDAQENWGEVLCLVDETPDNASYMTGTRPVVEPFVIGNPQLRMPDNLGFQPGTGNLYVLMDATTSAGDEENTNDDIWACLPDGADADTLSDGCVRVMTLLDGEAEFTGILWYPEGNRFLVNLQHRTQDGRATPDTTDMIEVSGFPAP